MKSTYFLFLIFFLSSCVDDSSSPSPTPHPVYGGDRLIICNEGLWQSDNGQLSYFDTQHGNLVNQWFRKVNGTKLGDTPNDIIQVNDTLIAISVNWSNIIQYIHPDGSACGATEGIPNNRCLATDGRYLYVTSYAHRCGNQTFEKGYVAKIDVITKQVVATCATGWEPEGICLFDGRLYIANTGGYAFAENHDYDSTIDVIDAATMTPITTINTGCINLSGNMSQAGQFICLSSSGNHYDITSRTIILNCNTHELTLLNFPSNLSTSDGTLFYTIGVRDATVLHTINPQTMSVTEGIYTADVSEAIRSLINPYALYISPYTGHIYFTDARSYATAGYLYGYSNRGEQLFEPQQLYLNPGRILALSNTYDNWYDDLLPTSNTIIVDEYVPAPGQFVNVMPEADVTDTPATMSQKCTERLNNGEMVSLGAFGGYITFHFDHPITNVSGEYDFLLRGNATSNAAEPGIVMVSQDINGNHLPDDEWYELRGSADEDNQENVFYNYEVTYTHTTMDDIPWVDNRGGVGKVVRNAFHTQEYYPLWIKHDLTLCGTLLPPNGYDASGNGAYWILTPLRYGYADNLPNYNRDGNSFNIEWAVDSQRQPVTLEYIDFIRVYTAVQQTCGWIGETSTEISGAEDLHLK